MVCTGRSQGSILVSVPPGIPASCVAAVQGRTGGSHCSGLGQQQQVEVNAVCVPQLEVHRPLGAPSARGPEGVCPSVAATAVALVVGAADHRV